MIAHMSHVMCDRCGNPASQGDDAKEARANALREGFKRIGRGSNSEDVCPRCWAEEQVPASTRKDGPDA